MLVGAWLEVDIDGPASGPVTGCRERLFLRMQLAGLTVVSLTGDKTFRVQHDGTDHGIRTGPVVSLAGEFNRMGGPMQVQVSITFCGIQSWQYTRAESNHDAVIDNRKRSTENLQFAFSAGSIDASKSLQ